MIRWAQGVVVQVTAQRTGAVELLVTLTGGASESAVQLDGLAYTALVGNPVPGDRVLLNTGAWVRGLGTGGLAMVVALPDRLPDALEGPGHLIKARYTPLQTMVLGVDEQDSEHHELLREADDLGGMPVVAADLHSSLPAVLAGVRSVHPEARVAYVMTDGGALPAAFSRTCRGLRDAEWLASVVTTGQSFGGDLEAVTVHTGLLAARYVVGADVAVVIQGPGNLGTGTRWGFSGVAAGEALNAASVLGGRPVAALRVSGADVRERHRGISHHSRTAYGRVLTRPADLVVPDLQRCTGVADELADRVAREAAAMASAAEHLNLVAAGCTGLAEAVRSSPVPVSSMGRGYSEDPAAFLAAAAAGRHAAQLLGAQPSGTPTPPGAPG